MPYTTVRNGITFINPVFIPEDEMKKAYETGKNPYGDECPPIDYKNQWVSEGRQLQWHLWQYKLGLNKEVA